MKIWDALKETIERGVWVGYGESDGRQRAMRYDAAAGVWWGTTRYLTDRNWDLPGRYKLARAAFVAGLVDKNGNA